MNGGYTRRGLFGLGGAASLLGLTSCDVEAETLSARDDILVNQVGYFAGDAMRVRVRTWDRLPSGQVQFELVDCQTGLVAAGSTARLVRSAQGKVGHADLLWSAQTEVHPEKLYCLQSGSVTSLPFRLSDAPFARTQRALTRALYLQRCGVALKDAETGLAHKACHLHDAVSKRSGAAHDCIGGWHDAGDFGKYVATTAVVIGELLSVYAEAPSQFGDRELALPESGDGEADLLSEMRVGLEWLIKMQRGDGAFERKASGDLWPSMTQLPEEDAQERFVYGVSTGETAKAAAALAIAARVFSGADAIRYLSAAKAGWVWLEANEGAAVDRARGDDRGSGTYLSSDDDGNYRDDADRLWVALELYLTSGDEVYRRDVASRAGTLYIWPASWANPSAIGLLNFLKDTSRDDVEGLRSEIEKRLIDRASEFELTARLSPFGVAAEEFDWGSNRDIAARGRILAAAFDVTGDLKFHRAALDQANYILGSNSFGLSFVTGEGANPVQNPHHRFDLATRARQKADAIPGLLVGGPNGRANTNNGGERYLDEATSFETNEFAIDYNAALIALLGRLRPAPSAVQPDLLGRLRQWLGL